MRNFYEKYKHAIPLIIYAFVYITWFVRLEQNVTSGYKIIHVSMDDYIPFCEYFIIPYFLWFAYVAFIVLYLFFKDKEDYARVCVFLFIGMTVFLVISTLFPNGQHLRPSIMPRDNIFTQLTARLYRTDTPTNIWPSIHVYNSLGAHFAIIKSSRLSGIKWIRRGSFILCSLIIMSTMFLKQHSVFDVATAFVMAAFMYGIVYKYDILAVYRSRLQKKAAPQIE